MRTWTTQDGTEIRIRDMETIHIVNCINMLQRALKEGRHYREIGGMGADNMDIWYEEIDISDEMREQIGFFQKELKRRNFNYQQI